MMSETPNRPLPHNIVTFVFTDVEGSTTMTKKMEELIGIGRYESEMRDPHRRLLWEKFSHDHSGFEVQCVGDGHMYVFQNSSDALQAVIEFQQALHTKPITCEVDGKSLEVKVRIGVHTSHIERELVPISEFLFEYPGTDTNFAARVGSLGVGGQIIVSNETHERRKNLGRPECRYHEWPNRLLKSFDDEPHAVYEILYHDNQTPHEPGVRFFPDFYKGERNRYIDRDAEERKVFAQFSNKRADGTLKRNDGTNSRLVTIKAEGGMGKTRLAVACAVKMVGLFDGNAHFVNLAFSSPTKEAVAEAIGKAMQPPIAPAPPDLLLALLKGRGDERTLLILDNYESVQNDEVARYLSLLVTETRGVHLLVTGRTAVGVSEVEQSVSLDGGMDEDEARALFLARARLKKGADWEPSDAEVLHIARLLRLTSVAPDAKEVNAIPLAVELVAAWVKLPLKAIADELQKTPLGSMTGPPRGEVRSDDEQTHERHRSLQRSLNWSYTLIGKREGRKVQHTFAACGLFADSFTPEAVEAITGAVEVNSMLQILENASLILPAHTEEGDVRYRQHRFTHEYARQRLLLNPSPLQRVFYCATVRRSKQLQMRFVAYYAVLVHENAATQLHMNRAVCRAILDREWRNALSAFEVAERTGNYVELRLLASIRVFLALRSWWTEWIEMEKRTLAVARKTGDRRGEGQTLNNLGIIYHSQGKWAEAIKVYEQAKVIFGELGDRHSEGATLNNLGIIYDSQGKWDKAIKVYEQDLAICRELGDRRGEGQTLGNLGNVYHSQGKWAEAIKVYEQAKVIFGELGDRHSEGATLNNLGIIYQSQGKWDKAIEVYEQSLVVKRELGDRHGQGATLNNLGVVYRKQGKWAEAIEVYKQSLVVNRELGDRHGQGATLNNLGVVYQSQGKWAEAIKVYEQAKVIFGELGDRHSEGQTLVNITLLWAQRGEFVRALPFARQSVVAFKETQDNNALNQAQELLTSIEQAIAELT